MSQVVISYPPSCYFFMPYLAPFLLKGHLVSGGVDAEAHDLNLEYHQTLVDSDFSERAVRRFASRGNRARALMAELLGCEGARSWRLLQAKSTYRDPTAVRAHASLLKSAALLAEACSTARIPVAPSALGQWTSLCDRARDSEVARFIAAKVEGGLYEGKQIVGISASYLEQLLPTLILARELKRRDPTIQIVVGGNALTHYFQEILEDVSFWTNVDFCVPFEGEDAFRDLCRSLIENLRVPEVNVATKAAHGIVYRKDLSRTRKLERIVPDFSSISWDYPTPEPVIPVLTSRGCYWGKCAFCTHHEGYGRGFRRGRDSWLTADLETYVDQGARAFYFVDEALPPRMLDTLAEVFGQWAAQGGRSCRWMAEARLEKGLTSAPAAEKLRQSGCRVLVNGIESGSQRVIDLMMKGIDLDAGSEFLSECRRRGIHTGWMFFVGFPGETEEEAEDTFRFIDGHREDLSFASIGAFVLERGSPIWNDPSRWGVGRILDSGKWYPRSYDFIVDGQLFRAADAEARRRSLISRYPRIHHLMWGAGDRALTLFDDDASSVHDDGKGIRKMEWHSKLAGGTAEVDFRTRRIEIRYVSNDSRSLEE